MTTTPTTVAVEVLQALYDRGTARAARAGISLPG
jgi:hypothetical protein